MGRKIFMVGVILCIATAFYFGLAQAKPLSAARKAEVKLETGDAELDQRLIGINDRARDNTDMFIESMARHFGISQSFVRELLEKKLSPADIYMAVLISKVTKQDTNKVLQSYNANKGKSWGVIAQELGIKPGSKEFHALKEDNFWSKEHKSKGKDPKGKGKTNQ